MKALIDLFACQTDSRFRGIGRYTHSLVREMINLKEPNELVLLANTQFPETFEDLRRKYSGLLPQGSFQPYSHPSLDITKLDQDPWIAISDTIVKHAYELLSPDVILYPSVFEGWGQRGVVPLPQEGFPSALRAAIVYDFIPYRFAEKFLDPFPIFKTGYLRRLASHKNFDLLLTISDSTRQDVINFCDVNPNKVVNISGAASSMFKRKEYTTEQIDQLFSRLKITKPYIFYTGNAEYHKNMEGMLRAFSKLPKDLVDNHQVVLTHTGDETLFKTRLRTLGLGEKEIVIAGHITDEELVMLFNKCKLFIFPSLFEGFGLPILEAMACGAPVIASNNSSIPEVVGRADALFDASSEESMGYALTHALTDDSFRHELSVYGLERVKQFSWEKTAQKTWAALQNLNASKNNFFKPKTIKGKARIALVNSVDLSSKKCDGLIDLLFSLENVFDIDYFENPLSPNQTQEPHLSTKFLPWNKMFTKLDKYETVLYLVDPVYPDDGLVTLIREIPGVVLFISIKPCEFSSGINKPGNFHVPFFLAGNFKSGRFFYLNRLLEKLKDHNNQAVGCNFVLLKLLRYAQEVIVTSDNQLALLNYYFGSGLLPRVSEIEPPNFFSETEPDVNLHERVAEFDSFRTEKIINVLQRATEKNEHNLFTPLYKSFLENKIPNKLVKLAATCAGSNYKLRSQPRILIDVTFSSKRDPATSIHRVLQDIVLGLIDTSLPDHCIDLVQMVDGKLYSSKRLVEKWFGLPKDFLEEEEAIEIRNSDYLLLLDPSWHLCDEYLTYFDTIRIHGGRIYTMVYDLHPLQFPENYPKLVLDLFKHWVNTALSMSDCIICLSSDVAFEVEKYVSNQKPLLVTSEHLIIDYLISGTIMPSLSNFCEDDFLIRLKKATHRYANRN